jgi:hypothetical protein
MCAVGWRCRYLSGREIDGEEYKHEMLARRGKGRLWPGVWLLSGVVGRLRDRKRMSAEERQVKSREVVSLELLDGRREAAARPTQPTCACSRYPARNFAGAWYSYPHVTGSLTARVSLHQRSEKRVASNPQPPVEILAYGWL